MIKLIASDLDGTLLDEKKRLPPETFDVIYKLKEKGILFVPSSGRQYASLEKMFRPVSRNMPFICENGALLKYNGKTLFSIFFPKNLARDAVAAVKNTQWGLPVICCEDCAYIDTDAEPFFSLTTASYARCKAIKNLEKIISRGKICKIAVYDKTTRANINANALRDALPGLKVVVSGYDWCDITLPEVNKGVAIRLLQQKFGINKEECMAFGDHMNDYEMLLECGQAFVTENGYPPLKEIIKNTIPSNENGGVTEYIKNKILL